MRGADKAVNQLAVIVADVGVIKARVAFQHGLAAHVPAARKRDCEHRVAHRRALAQSAPAAARAFEIAAREARAQRNRAVQLFFVRLEYFRGSDGAAENAEHRARMKAACSQRRDEVRREPLHDFVARHEGGDEFLAGGAGFLGRRQRARGHAGARVHEHPERIPLAAGERHPFSPLTSIVAPRLTPASSSAISLTASRPGLVCAPINIDDSDWSVTPFARSMTAGGRSA